jgi:methionine-rich copper-binding protein CopC
MSVLRKDQRTCALGLVAVLLIPAAAHAHARLLRSQPAKEAQLATPPARIDLWFNELLDRGFNGIEVFAAAELQSKERTNLTRGAAAVDPTDRTHLSVPLPALPPGEYVVEYRVLSRDGHSAPGRFTFRVVVAQ